MTVEDGLQNERTSLAWRRTALSVAVAGATMGHVASAESHLLGIGWITAGIVGALAILTLASATYRRRQVAGGASGSPTAVVVSAIVTVCFGILAVLYVLG